MTATVAPALPASAEAASAELASALLGTMRSLKGLHREVCEEAGVAVELAALGIVSTLVAHGPLRIGELSQLLHLELSTVSRQVTSVESRGWLTRAKAEEDLRSVVLTATDAGRAMVARLHAARAVVLTRRLTAWEPARLQALATELAAFTAQLHSTDH